MTEIEVRLSYGMNSQIEQHEVDRVIHPVQKTNVAVSKQPVRHNFICAPDRAATDDTPEDVVARLMPERETRMLARPVAAVFVSNSLGLLDIKMQMKTTCN